MKSNRILVVDDDAIVLRSCERILKPEGFEIHVADSAKDALRKMESESFDLLLIDVKMPDRDGIWLIQEIKKNWADIPIIVMSGYTTPRTILEGIESGAVLFIPKPFIPDELIESVRAVIQEE